MPPRPWIAGRVILARLGVNDNHSCRGGERRGADGELVSARGEVVEGRLADRDTYYADPLYEDVPLAELLKSDYASKRRSLIDMKHASLEQRPGDPRGGKPLLTGTKNLNGPGGPARDTTTCLVADRDGNIVAATPSGWSGVVAGETGV